MQFSEAWLRSFVNPSLTGEDLSHLLTMAGLEVEEYRPVAASFSNVVVGQVLTKEKHPNADRLNLLTVDVGQGAPLSIVCGAGNVETGMKAPCALVGAVLPGIEIKQAKVRGVESFGMMCSEKELGLAEESSGLMVLPVDAPVGQNVRDYLELNDSTITLKLTPNRCDCLSLYGIAREVAALTGTHMQAIPDGALKHGGEGSIKVGIEAKDACPRYMGRVIRGVNAKAPTPDWMMRRLQRSGLRPISAIVDVTNYVLLELGQPLHAFDLAKLSGNIAVRFAKQGEKIKLLNEQMIVLEPDMLVIADDKGPAALAGIMGGAESAVADATADIFLESAFFSPSTIVGKSRRLGFGSDSSYRFERGVDFAATQTALDRATELILDICGGEAKDSVEVKGELPARAEVKLRVARVARILGLSLDAEEITGILTRLGMAVRRDGVEVFVTPPSYRFDIAIEEDLIEEIARVYGYENIELPATMARMSLLPSTEKQYSVSRIRETMVLRDYQETINYAFVSRESEANLCANEKPVALLNPIASHQSVMRSSLLSGLIASLQTNLARKQPRVRMFEIGTCFTKDAQDERLAGLCYGAAFPEQWGAAPRNVDFFDVKSDVEVLLNQSIAEFVASPHPASHPGRSAQIRLNGKAIGWIGELHPKWTQHYDLPLAPVWFELELAAILESNVPVMAEVSRFPPVTRDLAVVVDEETPAKSLIAAMLEAKAPYVVKAGLFDLYRGKAGDESWGKGKKSLAFRVLLQDTQKTLMENEIEESIARLTLALEKLGAQLRS
jgi:phenylalanyl-tRNA synthetase beta chain